MADQGSSARLDSAATARLRAAIGGEVLTPDAEGYEAARRPLFSGFDGRPALIARPRSTQDVSEIVSFTRDCGMGLAVRSGGHSVAGHSTPDGAILLDLSLMKELEVDAEAGAAWAQTGLTALEYTAGVGERGLVTGLGDTGSVGIGGITLGGGIGYLARLFGLTVDDVLAAEVVTADGSVHLVDADHEPDLFWAIRGGGGNFGVVTRFRYRLHELPLIYGGMLVLPATAETLQRCLAACAAAPEALSAILNLMPAELLGPMLPGEHHGLVLVILACYAGPAEQGEAALAPLRSAAEPLAEMLREMPMVGLYQGEGPQPPPFVQSRAVFLDEVVPAAVARLVDRASSTSPGVMSAVQLRVLGGAMARVPVDATAFAHRDKQVMVTVNNFHAVPEDSAACAAWVEDMLLALDARGGGNPAYVGFLSDASEARVRQAYPQATYERLQEVKSRYDPGNIFRFNHNIAPAPG